MSYFNKIQLGSLSGSISTGSESQLKVTPFSSDGVEGVKLINGAGDTIETHNDYEGEPYLGTAVIQSIHSSTENITSSSLAVGASWTGSGEETFGISGIQVYHAADQNCIVYLDQSVDVDFTDTTQTIVEEMNGVANNAMSRVFMSVAPFYRLRVVNNGLATTTKQFTIAAMTPVINPLPASLSHGVGGASGRLDTESTLRDQQAHRHVKVSPTYELYTVPRNRLVGKAFVGDVPDTNFWTETSSSGGYASFAGDLELNSGTSTSGSAQYQSVHKARFVAGMVNEFVSVARFGQDPAAGYKAQMGAFDDTDGAFFVIDGTSFGVGTRYNGVDDIVWNGSFNGNLGPTIGGNFQIPNRYDMMYGGSAIEFYVGDDLIHTKYAIFGPDTFKVDFPITIQLENSGSTNDNSIHVRGCGIFRVGELNTSPVYHQISGVEDGILLKYGAGNLHTVVNTDNAGTMLIYDGIDATGKLIASMDLAKVVGNLTFNVDFGDGLFIVQTSAGSSTTIIYE